MQSLIDAHAGKVGPRFVANDGAPASSMFIIDKSNAASFVPESE